MAFVYGNNLSSTGVPAGHVGFNHSRVRVTSAAFDVATAATTDDLVFGIFNSNARIKDIRYYMTDVGTATTGAMNVGLWLATRSNGAWTYTVIDADLFASAVSIAATIAYPGTSIFAESAVLNTVLDRGKKLWELADIGAATYPTDPGYMFAIIGEVSTAVDQAIDLGVEIEYVAGD